MSGESLCKRIKAHLSGHNQIDNMSVYRYIGIEVKSLSINEILSRCGMTKYKLAKEFRKLCGKDMPCEIILIGGASILANYGFRDRPNRRRHK